MPIYASSQWQEKRHQVSTCAGIHTSTRHIGKIRQPGLLLYLARTRGKYIST